MAPVICVAVSQPLGRTILNNGSRIGSDEPCRGAASPSQEIKGARPHRSQRPAPLWHFVDDATAEIGFNYYVYALKKR
jgi:hypothetical protein